MKQKIKRLGLLLLLLTAILSAHADPVASLNENFDASTSIPAGWTQSQVAGNKAWYVPSFNGNNYAAMTGFKGNGPFDQWLISPAIDMSKVSKKVLTFDTQVNGYGSTQSALKVFVLTAADPTTAKTTQLNPTLATAPASGYSDWANSGELDLSAFSGIVYIGFEYTSPVADNYATWCVDNVKLNAEGGSTPDPDSTPDPTPAGDFKGDFNSFNNGQALSKPYGTYTNKTGWTASNAIILGGGDNDSNPIFKFIGAAGTLAPTLNGKTSAPGSLVSPALTGSIKTLTFKYGFAFNDSKCQFTVNVKDAAGNVIKSEVVTLDKIEKAKAYDFSLDVNYNGNFTIEIINNCYSQIADKNKDRVSIWNLTWTDINDKTFVYNNIQFEVFENSDSCYVIGGGSPELVIPATAINPKNNKTYKVTAIGSAAFKGTQLKSITIPEGVTSIWNDAFNGCQSLTSVKMPQTLKYLGVRAFYNCSKLNNISLRNTKSCGNEAFSGCTGLKSVDFSAITSLGNYAFSSCTSLTSIDLKSTTSLGEYAFKNCTGLKSVNLGNVTTINRSAFENCKNIASIDFGKVASIDISAFYGCASLTDVNLKNVTSLGGSTFSNCTGLKNVVLGKVTSFGGYTFSGCTSLTNVDLGNTESIGDYTFCGCTSLKYLDLKKVVTVGEYAFDGCSGLISIDLGSVKTLGRQGFSNCSGLTSIDLKNVVEIGRAAFYGCTGLTSIDLKMVTTLGCYAFSGCTGLKIAKLGKVGTWTTNYDSAYSDDVNSAFLNCTSLETVDLGENSTLGNYLFRGCTALKDIYLKNVSELGNGAFYGCTGLTELDLNKFAQLGTNTFKGCSGLRSLSILKASKLDASTFNGCDAIETLVLPYEWGADFKMTLSGTTQLRTLYIGENTASIPNKTFVNNKTLFEVYSNAATPPSIGTATFGSETYSYATLYVPQGSVDAYKAATGWSKFEDIQELPFQIVVKDKKVSVDRTKSILVSASVTPAAATSSLVKWYSLDDEVATVTTDGVVTGMAEGGVTLLAYCDGITSTMKVIVKKFDGVEDIMADDPTELSEFDVYNLQGIRVRANCTKEQLSELSHGIYILVSPQGRKKVII